MSKDKGFPWKAGDPTHSSIGMFIKDRDERPILRIYGYPGGSPDNLEGVTKAVNATYGNNINPEAVKEMLEIISEFNGLRNYTIPKHSEGLSLLDLFPGRFAKSESIIEKAKLI